MIGRKFAKADAQVKASRIKSRQYFTVIQAKCAWRLQNYQPD